MSEAPEGMEWYYRPGTTEPELRPIPDAEPAEATAPSALKGKLPEGFPGLSALEAEGITTYAKVRKRLDSLTEISGIGEATAEKIQEAMNESSEAEEEAE